MKDLEFLPEHHLRARLGLRLRLVRLWLLIVLALAMVCWTLYSRSGNAMLEAKIAATENALAGVAVGLRRVADQNAELRKCQSQRALVDELKGGGPRTLLVREIAARLPDEIFLSRLEIVTEKRGVPAAAGRGQSEAKPAGKDGKETVDRVRIEGFAADDLALARFLQGLGDSGVFQKGELAFSKDAQIAERSVRVFAATFYVTPKEQKKVAAEKPQGGQL
jgi:Tfp pilus assembly protein PilN